MVPVARGLLALPLLLQPASSLRRAVASTSVHIDPTFPGQTWKYREHQPWIAELFANRTLAEEELNKTYPAVLTEIKTALADAGRDWDNYKSVCGTISSIGGLDHSMKPYLAAAGGIEVSMLGLRTFNNWPETDLWPQRYREFSRRCAISLAILSQYQKDVQEEAGKAGAVEATLRIQTRFWKHAIMQVGDLQGTLMEWSDANRQRWMDADGMNITLSAMRRHWTSGQAVENCWYALAAGMKGSERQFVEQGGIEQAMRSLEEHREDFPRVREKAIDAIRSLARCEDCEDLKAQLVSAGFLEMLAEQMQEVPGDIHIQSPACSAVYYAVGTNTTSMARAVKAGLAELSLKAIRNFPGMTSSVEWKFNDQYTVYEDCAEALSVLVHDKAARTMLKEANAAGDMKLIVSARPDSQRLKDAAARVLEALGDSLDG